jgi:hypothetical protein
MYDAHREDITNSYSSRIAFCSNFESKQIHCEICLDDQEPNLKTIGNSVSESFSKMRYPAHAGVAIPLSEATYRIFARSVAFRGHQGFRPRLGNFVIHDEPKSFMAVDVQGAVDFMYELKPFTTVKNDFSIYMIGVNPASYQEHDEKILVDDSLLMDPHVLFIYPSAVSFIAHAHTSPIVRRG